MSLEEHPKPQESTLQAERDGQPGWRRTLYVMWIAELICIVGFSFVMPFIPFYIRELGVTDERLVPIWAGILVTAPGLMFAVFSPIWGIVADRYGRKLVLLALMGTAKNVYQLLALRLVQGAITGTVAASIALVSSVTPLSRLGYSLGLMQTAVFAGNTVGPWLGGITADHYGYRIPFYIAGGLLFLGGWLVLVGARERFSRPSVEMVKANGSLGEVANHRGFPTMLAVVFFINLGGTIVAPIFPLFVESLVAVKAMVASTTGLVIAISGLMAAVSAGVIGRISDRIGYKKVLVGCTLFSGIFCIPQAIAQSVGQLLGIRALFGLVAGGTGPAVNALVGKITPRNSYGRAYGLVTSVGAVGGAMER